MKLFFLIVSLLISSSYGYEYRISTHKHNDYEIVSHYVADIIFNNTEPETKYTMQYMDKRDNNTLWLFSDTDKCLQFQFGGYDFSLRFEEDDSHQVEYREMYNKRYLVFSTPAPKEVMDKFIDDAMMYFKRYFPREEQYNLVYVYSTQFDFWSVVGKRDDVPLDSLILPEGTLSDILKEMYSFRDEKKKERLGELGYPNKKTYLLEGMWGSGKTSLIKVLATKFKAPIYYLSLGGDMNDEKLAEALSKIYVRPAFLVFEDIDYLFENRTKNNDVGNGMTFSGLLNTFDGVTDLDGLEIFLTTNFVERLDPALIRPGRVNKIVSFGCATDYQISQVYQRVTLSNDEQAEEFVKKLRYLGYNEITVAMLKGYLYQYVDMPDEAIQGLHEFNQYVR